MAEEEQIINPTPVETEESEFDPMEMMSRIDQAHQESLKQTEEVPADNPPAEEIPPSDQPNPGETAPPNPGEDTPPADVPEKGGEYTAEEIRKLEAAARKAIQYHQILNSDDFRQAMELLKRERAGAAAAEAQKRAETEDPYDTADKNYRKRSAELLGIDESDDLYNAFNEKVKAEVERQTKGLRAELDQVRASREEEERLKFTAGFARKIMKDLDMPEAIAKQAAARALYETSQKHPRFDPNVYYNEFIRFKDQHLVPAKNHIMNARIAELEQELEQLKNNRNPNPEPTPQNTSTAEAAQRILSQKDAGYKANGGIPGGSQVSTGIPDDGTQIADMIASLNGDFM